MKHIRAIFEDVLEVVFIAIFTIHALRYPLGLSFAIFVLGVLTGSVL